MTRMGDIFADVERDLHLDHLIHHEHHDAPQPAAAPAITHNETSTQEAHPMSFMDTVEAKASDLMAELRNVDHRALDALELVLANPATADAFYTLGDLAHLPPPVLATGLDVLKMIRAVTPPPPPASIAPDAQQAPLQPAGPVVAGQA